MISFEATGKFDKTDKFFEKMTKGDIFSALEKYASEGVSALASATPARTGLTAQSWSYEIKRKGASFTITWTNSHVVNGVPIAVILQYGHGTGTGGYVQGRDYINPALRPVFDKIAAGAWKAVTSA